MVSVQRTPTLSYVVLPEGTRRGSVFTVHETGAPVPSEYLSRQIAFNQWFKGRTPDLTPAVELVDTTSSSVSSTAEEVAAWIRAKLESVT